jgi:hypothetical protein
MRDEFRRRVDIQVNGFELYFRSETPDFPNERTGRRQTLLVLQTCRCIGDMRSAAFEFETRRRAAQDTASADVVITRIHRDGRRPLRPR